MNVESVLNEAERIVTEAGALTVESFAEVPTDYRGEVLITGPVRLRIRYMPAREAPVAPFVLAEIA